MSVPKWWPRPASWAAAEGCLAFSEADRQTVMDRLGAGRLIYAGKA
ncbi:MAG: hypothetical protein NVV72_11985 [Asticcacaulis sp.]|nr:hypothetical protein [Asticcacaulis sp.]